MGTKKGRACRASLAKRRGLAPRAAVFRPDSTQREGWSPGSVDRYRRQMSFSHGAEWKALMSRYIGTIPPSGDAWCIAAQRKSGSPPLKAVSSAMMAKVGVAARHSQSAAWQPDDPRLLANTRFEPAGRDAMKISVMVVPQRLPVPRSSEYPAFTRGHWTMGRPLVRYGCMPFASCGQPAGESSHRSCRP